MKTNQELCDTCGAKAYYVARNSEQELYFCGSHTRKNSVTLLEKGFTIYPNTYDSFGAELQEEFEAKNSTLKFDEQQTKVEEFEALRNKIKILFYANPAETLNNILIPTARNETQYHRNVKMHLGLNPDRTFSLNVEPAQEPANENEVMEFMIFDKTLKSIIASTLA